MENSPLDIIFRWHSEEARDKFIFDGDRRDVERYLQAVDEIQRYDDYSVIQMAMARLELEFRNILISHVDVLTISLTSPSCLMLMFEVEDEEKLTVPLDVINDLCCIAERMISSGYLGQCIEVYATARKSSVFDATFRRLEIDDVEWGKLNPRAMVLRWTEAFNFCVWSLFDEEKMLCKKIFNGVETFIAHACFLETVKPPIIHLLNVAETAGITLTSSPNDLFHILHLYTTLEYLQKPQNHPLFDCDSISVMAAEVLCRLAAAARETFSLFENNVFGDTSKVVVPNGEIHPLTTYVMNSLRLIFDSFQIIIYEQTLNKVIVSKPSSTPDMDFSDLEGVEEGKTPLQMHLIWIIEILKFKLDGKSKQYKDESLSHMFIMNNVHYIFRNVSESNKLREMVGDDYLNKLTMKTHQAATSYEMATWGRMLHCLREEGLYAKNGGVIKKTVFRKRIKAFNTMFDKVMRTQAVWLIQDSKLRKDLRKSILQKLIPAYESFVGRNDHNSVGLIKYSVRDLPAAVSDCFKGIPDSQHLGRRYQRWWQTVREKMHQLLPADS
ncbi:hypothetical protein RJT34_17049 [Clitoria ternatea]|uniref:Exocyst subunit Exo70 family protein n=1 Tax=Clitoria ternatea TaxID=43366 RepID=A0AAN9J881_CLITE